MRDIFNSAFRSKNGEYAWKAEDILDAVNHLSQLKMAILGGEVWIINKEGQINELYWFDFKVHDKKEYESWSSFVESTSQEFLNSFLKIKEDKSILEEKEAMDDEVYFNISFLDEEGYSELKNKVDDFLNENDEEL